ncbi:MAG TPA: glutathione S-transferase C-terminal domain-containing protein [Conexibacter sp.]|nr:glutathione S-transferase C-terminal domain-containing protein [Conexibacter sp.]
MAQSGAADAVQFPKEADGRGAFVRQQSRFRDWITTDGSGDHPAAAGRYHLYVSLACPWACRTLIVRRLKRLEDVIGLTVVDPLRDERGWRFLPEEPDPVNGFAFVAEAYAASDPSFDGRVTVPVLWDKQAGRIVNNESAEIVRMLGSAFDEWGDPAVDLYPEPLRDEIDALNERIYETVNNGVYRAGFASTQAAYEEAFESLFETLDWLDERLAGRRYLTGERITEADWRLFVTLVRFDAVYVGHLSATDGGSPTTRSSTATCAPSTSSRGSPRRSTSTTSSAITT